jgi:hypothetical protein
LRRESIGRWFSEMHASAPMQIVSRFSFAQTNRESSFILTAVIIDYISSPVARLHNMDLNEAMLLLQM